MHRTGNKDALSLLSKFSESLASTNNIQDYNHVLESFFHAIEPIIGRKWAPSDKFKQEISELEQRYNEAAETVPLLLNS
jgi:hypothetical protein